MNRRGESVRVRSRDLISDLTHSPFLLYSLVVISISSLPSSVYSFILQRLVSLSLSCFFIPIQFSSPDILPSSSSPSLAPPPPLSLFLSLSSLPLSSYHPLNLSLFHHHIQYLTVPPFLPSFLPPSLPPSLSPITLYLFPSLPSSLSLLRNPSNISLSLTPSLSPLTIFHNLLKLLLSC